MYVEVKGQFLRVGFLLLLRYVGSQAQFQVVSKCLYLLDHLINPLLYSIFYEGSNKQYWYL